jgi:hypothetical protein
VAPMAVEILCYGAPWEFSCENNADLKAFLICAYSSLVYSSPQRSKLAYCAQALMARADCSSQPLSGAALLLLFLATVLSEALDYINSALFCSGR